MFTPITFLQKWKFVSLCLLFLDNLIHMITNVICNKLIIFLTIISSNRYNYGTPIYTKCTQIKNTNISLNVSYTVLALNNHVQIKKLQIKIIKNIIN